MNRSKSGMGSTRSFVALMAMLSYVAVTNAGPLGPLPTPGQNLTSADMALKEGSCALGDVVYMLGDEFPGAGPCERCACGAGGVRCAQQRCEPRPGCKALHRPDHCCPTYQCECEQEGRVYGNGEKLVDPADPCRVCYCQGGEVVCRRIACFLRDDCSPRLVPGRCCPEYDNCPLRGVTSLPGLSSPAAAAAPSSSAPAAPTDIVKPAITIKEITPKAEIPIITDVKIKEILPSPSIEVAEYSSSKSPLIPREATSQKTSTDESPKAEQEMPSVVEVHSFSQNISSEESITSTDGEEARAPSKISLSTQDSINSEIYPSPVVPIVATMGTPITVDASSVTGTTRAPVIEDEDPSLFDHNPAFPPLPDDLSNHGEEIIQEPSVDSDHVPVEHLPEPQPEVIVTSITTSSEAEAKEVPITTVKNIPDAPMLTTVTSDIPTESSTIIDSTSTAVPTLRENPTVKLRSAIPTEIFSTSSEDKVTATEDNQDFATQTSTSLPKEQTTVFSTTTDIYKVDETTQFVKTQDSEETPKAVEINKYEDIINSAEIRKSQEIMKSEEIFESSKSDEKLTVSEEIATAEPETPIERVSFITTDPEPVAHSQLTTARLPDHTTNKATPSTPQEQTTNSIAKSNIATEVTSQTELLSSLPIETSDQKPHESSVSENVSKDSLDSISTADSITELSTTTNKPASSEIVNLPKTTEGRIIENVETTEFILTSFGSSESSTDAVELIKIPGDADRKAAIIDRAEGNKNALTDLIKLVSDVASMSDHTEAPAAVPQAGPVDSEELLFVNAGYKSKNSNFNQNSITEIPFKSKSVTVNKQKVVEIEDDEESGITDSAPPNDKVEPTTRRPTIDSVSDDKPAPPSHADTATGRKDIEIITQSYVPTINRRPTKVVLQEPADEPRAARAGPASAETTAAPRLQ